MEVSIPPGSLVSLFECLLRTVRRVGAPACAPMPSRLRCRRRPRRKRLLPAGGRKDRAPVDPHRGAAHVQQALPLARACLPSLRPRPQVPAAHGTPRAFLGCAAAPARRTERLGPLGLARAGLAALFAAPSAHHGPTAGRAPGDTACADHHLAVARVVVVLHRLRASGDPGRHPHRERQQHPRRHHPLLRRGHLPRQRQPQRLQSGRSRLHPFHVGGGVARGALGHLRHRRRLHRQHLQQRLRHGRPGIDGNGRLRGRQLLHAVCHLDLHGHGLGRRPRFGHPHRNGGLLAQWRLPGHRDPGRRRGFLVEQYQHSLRLRYHHGFLQRRHRLHHQLQYL